MEEVDSILLYTLKQIGCDVNSIADLTPQQIILCVTKCFAMIKPEEEIPRLDSNLPMSSRYKIANQIAQCITDLGYNDEIGCQSFLYPTEAETRKLLIFLVEKLPRDTDSEMGNKIELLSKLAQENEDSKIDEFDAGSGIEVDGIRLPASVDVDSLPKETLKFYASHLADITFAKQREKFKKPSEPPPPTVPSFPDEHDDDDFGDPDEPIVEKQPDIEISIVSDDSNVSEKFKSKPPIPEKPKMDHLEQQKLDKEAEIERMRAAEIANKIKAMQKETKRKALLLKDRRNSIKSRNQSILTTEEQLELLKLELMNKEKNLDKQKKLHQLITGSEDSVGKIRSAIDAQKEKIMNLVRQWEKHRRPLIQDIREKRCAVKQSDSTVLREEVKSLKAQLRLMGQEAAAKEELYNQLMEEYEKLPKDVNRSSYTKRICEIIGNIKKQKREITKVITDTKEIQKEINTLSGRLDRTFAVADELIFKDAEKDKNVAQSYKLLVAIHSDFSRVIKTVEDANNLKRLIRDFEDKFESEKSKTIEDKLKRLRADLIQMRNENKVLEAKLRDPSLQIS